MTYPNGLQSQFTLDNLNRVTSLNNARLIYDYTLDAAGNRRQVVEHLPNETGRTVNWSYDNIYRLTDEVITLDPHSKNGNAHYDLDPVGNRTQETATLPGLLPGSFTYDADDRLNTETYDANGNTLTSGGKTFAYDFENRLKSMTEGSVTVTIQYDADGNRVAKTVNGVTTRYLVDDLNPTGYSQVVEEVTTGAISRTYTYGLQRISQNQLISNTWTPSFYGYDGAGTVRLLTDSTGTVTDTYDYGAWGNTVNTTGSTPNVYLYRGEQYDPDLGLYYLRARWYNLVTGRLLTKDPYPGSLMKPATLHRYLYAAGDPVNGSDPSGRNALLVTMVEVEEDVAPMEAADLSLGQTASLSLRKPWGAASEYMFLMVGMAGQFGARSSATVVSTALNIDCIWVEESSIMDIGAEVASGADVSGIQASSQQCESLPKRKRPCKCDQPGDQGHHLLPFGGGKMELLFNKCGVDVNDLQYMVCLAGPDHTEVHGAGYNPNWLQWLLGAIKSGTCNPTTVRQHLLDLLKGPGSPFAGPLNSGRKCTNSPTAPFGYSPMRAM